MGSVLQSVKWIGFGPIRTRRLALSVFFTVAYWNDEELPKIVVLVGVACFLRSMMTGLRDRDAQLIAYKFFRNIALNKQDVVSIRFEARGMSAAKRLVIETRSGETIDVTGVSIWSFPVLLPWQKPEKRLLQLERFLAQSNVAEAYSAP